MVVKRPPISGVWVHHGHLCSSRQALSGLFVAARGAIRSLDSSDPLPYSLSDGGVAKWPRRRSAKPLFAGSTPAAASNPSTTCRGASRARVDTGVRGLSNILRLPEGAAWLPRGPRTAVSPADRS